MNYQIWKQVIMDNVIKCVFMASPLISKTKFIQSRVHNITLILRTLDTV